MTLYERIDAGEFDIDYNFFPGGLSGDWGKDGATAKAHWKKVRAQHDVFRVAALQEVGLESHPNQELLYNMAWWETYCDERLSMKKAFANLENLAKMAKAIVVGAVL